MAINEPFSFTASISTTEYSLTNNSTSIATSTTAGVYSVVADMANMVAGDQYAFYYREKAISGGTQRQNLLGVLLGAQGELANFTIPYPVNNGWDLTCKRLAGADRSISWSIKKIA